MVILRVVEDADPYGGTVWRILYVGDGLPDVPMINRISMPLCLCSFRVVEGNDPSDLRPPTSDFYMYAPLIAQKTGDKKKSHYKDDIVVGAFGHKQKQNDEQQDIVNLEV